MAAGTRPPALHRQGLPTPPDMGTRPPALHRQGLPTPPDMGTCAPALHRQELPTLPDTSLKRAGASWALACLTRGGRDSAGLRARLRAKYHAREGKATCICTRGVPLGSPSTGHWQCPSVPAPNTLLGPESPRFLFPAAETSGLPRKGRECFTTRSERRQRALGWCLLRRQARAQGTCAC